ncbi:MAG: methyltransferase, partial [Actinobacteria bacterium]
MRVVAGVAGGRKLQAPAGRDTRPTSDRVREAVFASLSGALGIEALSRGAASATFVDDDPAAITAVRANLASTGVDGGEAVRADAVRWLDGDAAFDLALVDPPYSFNAWDVVFSRLRAKILVAESNRDLEIPSPWRIVRHKRYGGTVVHLAA